MNLNELRDKLEEAVRRDINHIFTEVSRGKLSATSARDLVAYTKLLEELASLREKAIAEEEADLKKKSPEELKKLAQEILNAQSK